MPRIANAFGYDSQIGDTIANISKILLSGNAPDPSATRLRSAQADLATMKAIAAQHASQNMGKVGAIFSQMPTQRANLSAVDGELAADPGAMQGDLPETTPAYDARQGAQQFFAAAPSNIAAAAAGVNPEYMKNIGDLYRFTVANTPGTSDNEVVRALAGAGKPIGVDQAVSIPGQEAVAARNQANTIATAIAKQRSQPVNVGPGATVLPGVAPDGSPDLRFVGNRPAVGRITEAVAKGEAFNKQPADVQAAAVGPSESQVKAAAAGALPQAQRLGALFGVQKTADSASPSGITYQSTPQSVGSPGVAPMASKRTDIFAPTTSTQTQAQQELMNINGTRAVIAQLKPILADPRNFGAAGAMRETVQDAIQQGSALAGTLGGQMVNIQKQIQASGSQVGLDKFDPHLPQLEAIQNILGYRVARMMNPGNRLSDRDFEQAMKIVGGTGPMANQQEFTARLASIEQMLNDQESIAMSALTAKGNSPPGAGVRTIAPKVAAPVSAAPVQKWGRDASGRPVRVQ